MTGEGITSVADPSAIYGALVTAFERVTGDLTDADQRSVLRDATVTLTGVRPNTFVDRRESAPDRPAGARLMQRGLDEMRAQIASDEDREALALALWDEGIVRPESVARQAVDRILDDPLLASRPHAAPSVSREGVVEAEGRALKRYRVGSDEDFRPYRELLAEELGLVVRDE